MNWILYGFKGAGKSTLAKRLPLPSLDTDHLIETQMGISVRDIVRYQGWEQLRSLERETLKSLDIDGHVIAVGGSTPLDPINLNHLKRLGKLIYLAAPKSLILKRQLTAPFPLFIDPNAPESSFERMWSIRNTEYEKIADFRVELEGKTITQAGEMLWQVINLETSFALRHGENPMGKPSES